jgi:putative cell wall-binding protein
MRLSSRRSPAIALGCVLALAVTVVAPSASADDGLPEGELFSPSVSQVQLETSITGVERLAGADRFGTAVAISEASFEPGVPFVVIANGLSFPDALSGAPVAGLAGAPVLLVTAQSIPASVKAELTRLKPDFIAVLGGVGAVSAAVASQLQSYALSGDVERLSGSDRFATSAAIADVVWDGDPPSTVYVTNGMTFPDALAAGPVAGLDVAPILLVQKDQIPAPIKAQLQEIRPASIVVVGGPGAVSSKVLGELDALSIDGAFRISGGSRFETAANLSSWFWEGIDASTVFISSGMQFPDALSIAPVAAGVDGPLLLVQKDTIPEAVKAELAVRQPERIVIVGGTGAVSQAVEAELAQYIVAAP